MNVLAVIGATALYLLYGWLASAIVASDLSDRKGYGEKIGLAFGLLGAVVGIVIWLAVPPKAGSPWSRYVRMPDLATAVAALILFVLLLLPWYEGGSSFFEEVKWYELLVPLVVVVCYLQLHVRAGGRATAGLGAVVLGAALVALTMAVVALLTPPGDASLELPAYLGVILAAAMAVSAALAFRVDRGQAESGAATVAEARRTGAETA